MSGEEEGECTEEMSRSCQTNSTKSQKTRWLQQNSSLFNSRLKVCNICCISCGTSNTGSASSASVSSLLISFFDRLTLRAADWDEAVDDTTFHSPTILQHWLPILNITTSMQCKWRCKFSVSKNFTENFIDRKFHDIYIYIYIYVCFATKCREIQMKKIQHKISRN